MAGSRYTTVAILLHWAIALAIVANLALGVAMRYLLADSSALTVASYQVHKSIGLTVLALSLLRLAWRLTHRPPALPDPMPAWEQRAARAVHGLFYCLMLALPLSGWLYVSAQWRDGTALQVPTLWFGLFEVPHLAGLDQASDAIRARRADQALTAHAYLAGGTALLLVLHIGAALKHHWFDRDRVLASMVPALDESDRGRAGRWGLRAGLAGLAGATLAILLTQFPWFPDARSPSAETTITAAPGAWSIVAADSHIEFSGVHAGNAFTGRFTRWQINAQIKRGDVTASTITAKIATASATDGVALHDRTLPQSEWFDSNQHPYAHYRASEIKPIATNRYAVKGTLTIKGHPIEVPQLTLTVNGEQAIIDGAFTIDRKTAHLGMESDPGGRWVSRQIGVEVRARLSRP